MRSQLWSSGDTIMEAHISLLPAWLNLDSCSIIRLATLVLALSIAAYLLSRKGKSKATLFLALTFCAGSLFNLSSLLEFAGFYYWQPRNLKNLLVPLLQDVGPSGALLSLLLFAYYFPCLPQRQKREFQFVISAALSVNVVMLALTVYNFVFLERKLSYFLFTMTYYTLLYVTLALQLLLVVLLLLRKAVLLSAGKSRSWWERLRKPLGKDAGTARSLALALLLVIAAIGSYAFMTYGYIPLPLATYFIWLAFLLFYSSFVVTYLNHAAERSTIQVKLIGLTLIPVLSILGLVALFVGKATETDYAGQNLIPLERTILIKPNRLGGYDITENPLRFDTDLGEKVDIGYGKRKAFETQFDFPFFSHSYRTVHVLHGPMIYLGRNIEEDGWGGYRPNPAIAALIMNLDPSRGRGIFLKNEMQTLTVTWRELPEFALSNANTVQLTLHSDGSFSMSFAGLSPQGRYSSVQMYNFTTATTTGRHPGSKGKAIAYGAKLTGIHPGAANAPLKRVRLTRDLPYSGAGAEAIFDSYEADYTRYLHDRMAVLAVVLIASSLFILFFFPVLFRTNLIQPLYALAEGMRRADGGDLDATVSPRFRDEIGFLTRSFNRMLQSIKKAEANFWMLAESAQDGILILRGNLPVYANRRICEVTGYSKTELLKIEFSSLVRSGSMPSTAEWQAQPIEALIASKAGPGIPVELTSSPTTWHGQTADVIIVRDITERKKGEERLHQRQQRLLQTDKLTSLGVLVAGMVHQISIPTQSILSNSSLLTRACPAVLAILEERAREKSGFLIAGLDEAEFRRSLPGLLTDIETCSKRIDQIIKDLKSFSREDPFPIMSSIDINAVIKAAVVLASSYIKRATDHFNLELDPELPKVKGNAMRMEQVVINLLLNACQALADRDKSVLIRSRPSEDMKRVLIEFQDEGVGIPSEHLARIKEPFFTTKRAAGGSGLGLYVVATIVNEHQGTFDISSQPGKGTVAVVTLPAEEQK
jgi:PAS domain S-box-containing protein